MDFKISEWIVSVMTVHYRFSFSFYAPKNHGSMLPQFVVHTVHDMFGPKR